MNPLLPAHLSQHSAQGLQTGQSIAQFELGDHKNFIYLALDWDSHRALIIDPQNDIDTPLRALQDHPFDLIGVLLTHTHFDHIAGLPALIERFPQIPVYVHALESHRLPEQIQTRANIQKVQDLDWIAIGAFSKARIQALHTPGHSAGEMSYHFAPYLFTGDTVFIRDCGRTDLGTGSNDEMFKSLQRIKALPPETIILPGHHYVAECATTLEAELNTSAPFQCASVEELARLP